MSFCISFVARSVEDARAKLAQQHAPGAIKAVIESALDTMPVPQPPSSLQAGVSSTSAKGTSDGCSSAGARPSWLTGFFGVSVEASGHIGGGYAQISKLEVRPLVA